jgi:hypothetical protein
MTIIFMTEMCNLNLFSLIDFIIHEITCLVIPEIQSTLTEQPFMHECRWVGAKGG